MSSTLEDKEKRPDNSSLSAGKSITNLESKSSSKETKELTLAPTPTTRIRPGNLSRNEAKAPPLNRNDSDLFKSFAKAKIKPKRNIETNSANLSSAAPDQVS